MSIGRRAYPDCTATLTGPEIARPFMLADEDDEPLPVRTRLALEWIGRSWAEIDPATGEVIAEGSAPADEAAAQATALREMVEASLA